MKIAFIIPSLANRGPIIVVKELIEQMTINNHLCTVFYFDEKKEVDFSCPVYKIKKGDRVDFSQFKIVHSHGIRPDRYVWKHRKYDNQSQTIYISTIHNFVMDDLKYQYNRIIAWIFGNIWMRVWLSRHDKIVVLSRYAISYYEKWFTHNKLAYAYNTRTLDTSKNLITGELNELQLFKGDSVLIGANALLSPRKGIDILVKYLNKLPDNYKLFIVGDGKSRKYLETLSRQYGVSDRCHFAGYKVDAYRYLSHYDIFAMPSRSEGFPLALLEAAIYKCPSVTSDIPIIKEAFDNSTVSMFELSRPETITEAIDKATNNPLLGENMFKKYKESYSPEKMYQRYIEIYKEVIG